MKYDYKNAVTQAKAAGVNPIRYTTVQGGDWHKVEPFVTPSHVHSIEFDNGQRWDEVNGWNFMGRHLINQQACYQGIQTRNGMC